MLQGIKILNQTEIFEAPLWWAIAVVISFLISILGTIATTMSNSKLKFYSNFLFTLVALIVFVCCCCMKPYVSTGKYRYRVTIDDNVSFTELYKKYDVIGQDGKIWTLEDKENEYE